MIDRDLEAARRATVRIRLPFWWRAYFHWFLFCTRCRLAVAICFGGFVAVDVHKFAARIVRHTRFEVR